MINIAFSLSTLLGSFIFYYQSDKIFQTKTESRDSRRKNKNRKTIQEELLTGIRDLLKESRSSQSVDKGEWVMPDSLADATAS